MMFDTTMQDGSSPDFLPHSSRRGFLKMMGAGALLYGLVLPACKRANKYLVPYNASPEWTLPGVSTRYATCRPGPRGATPILAVCREGRPIRLEPQNFLTESPGLPASIQASILDLYDPGRSKSKLFNGKPADEAEFKGAFAAWARKVSSGGGTAFVFSENDSPLRDQMVEEIRRRNPHARFYSWEPLSKRNLTTAAEQNPAQGIVPLARFNNAKKVLSLDCDFLAHDVQGYTGDFMKGRIPEGADYAARQGDYSHLNRLYMAEGRFSVTGGMADERLPIAPSQIAALLWQLARSVRELTNAPGLSDLPDMDAPLTDQQRQWIDDCARDLCGSPGQSLVLLGSPYPPEMHRAAFAVNSALNADGITRQYLQTGISLYEPLANLPAAIEQGKVDTLFFCCEADPVTDSPQGKEIKALLARPELTSVRLGLYVDETAHACTWHIPAAHYLESWGLERDLIGRYCCMQPVIAPLYGGVSEAELLHGLLHSRGILAASGDDEDRPSPVYQRIRKCFDQAVAASDKQNAFSDALKAGISAETAFPHAPAISVVLDRDTWLACHEWTKWPAPDPGQGKYEIQFVADYSVDDGRHIRNAWLRECPDPMTGLCWDAPAQLSPAAMLLPNPAEKGVGAARLAIRGGNESSLFTACPVPGTAEGLIVLPLGYDADPARPPAAAYGLRHSSNGIFMQVDAGQLEWRNLSQEAVPILPPADSPPPPQALVNAQAPPPHEPRQERLFDPATSSDPLHQWAMSIDLSLCIGCNACLIACQAENNIPTVGPEEIARGRMMHWIRIDRYFIENKGEASPSFMAWPVACQQCEQAPCESVCPVNATTHTSEGLNAMVYPRCWGTRYCSANCPYKARRFNFFDYAKACDESVEMQRNPHVTVRSRGVMEKCTYCVQRIEDAKARHKAAVMAESGGSLETGSMLADDELRLPARAVKTACQLACPAGAITFGNLLQKDPVVDARQSARASLILEDLGTKPRTSYLAKIRNRKPEQED